MFVVVNFEVKGSEKSYQSTDISIDILQMYNCTFQFQIKKIIFIKESE